MTVDIKLTCEQHEVLLDRLGSEEAIREWVEACIDQELRRVAAGPMAQQKMVEDSLTRAFDELNTGRVHHDARNLFKE